MEVICQYCNTIFANEKTVKAHQKTAKYCLKIQKEDDLKEELKYVCEYCSRKFTHKHVLVSHSYNCKEKTANEKESQLERRDKQLGEMRSYLNEKDKQIIDLKDQLDEKEKQIENLQNKIFEIAISMKSSSAPTINNTNTNTNTNTNITVNNVNNDIRLNINDTEKMKKILDDNLTGDVLAGGQKGIARMVHIKFLTGPNGEPLYKCVDASRQNFEYINQDGHVERDVKAHKLRNTIVKGNICEKAINLGLSLWMREDGSTDETQYRIYGDKVIEVSNMSFDDSKFRSELSTLTSL